MREVSVPFCARSRLRKGVEMAWKSAFRRDRPFTLWAPHSALMRSHGTPHTFSV